MAAFASAASTSSSDAALEGVSLLGRVFARIGLEITAFFEELHAAQVRTNAQEPFGL